jgi:hypothetical protein
MDHTLTPPIKQGMPRKDESGSEEEVMSMSEIWARMEKHEAECNLRYQRIDEKLGEQKTSMKALDLKIWGLAVLIIIAPMVHKFLA